MTTILATVGPPLGKRLGFFDESGSPTVLLAPAELVAAVAGGRLPRLATGPQVSTQQLHLDMTRLIASDGDGHSWQLVRPDIERDAFSAAEASERLRQLLLQAAWRGENVILGQPGLAELATPCVRASALPDDEGSYLQVVEAFPPVTTGVWAGAIQDQDCSCLTRPMVPTDFSQVINALITGCLTFASAPELTGLYFERSVSGPLPRDR